MTVKELVPYLWKPKTEGSVCIVWGEHEYAITYDSPVLEMFGDFLVKEVAAVDAYVYCIYLKERRPYMKEGDHEED